MSGMAPLSAFLPVLARDETRCVEVRGMRGVPADEYGFVELFCTDPDCDCRRVLLFVLARKSSRPVAVINHAFEPPARGSGPEGQTFLDPLHPQSRAAPAILRVFKEVVLDRAYAARLERHYEAFKAALPRRTPDAPAEEDDVDVFADDHGAADSDTELDAADADSEVEREYWQHWRPVLGTRTGPAPAGRSKPGRNAPCPCGSGKKYKRCCEGRGGPGPSVQTPAAAADPARLPWRTPLADAYDEVHAALGEFALLPRNKAFRAEAVAALDIGVGQTNGDPPKIVQLVDSLQASLMVHEYVGPDGRSLRERFAAWARARGGLAPLFAEAIELVGSERLRFLEVRAVRPEEGIELRDLTSGENFFVCARAPTREMVRHDLLLGRFRRFATHLELNEGYPIPRPSRAGFDAVLAALLRDLRKVYADARPEDVFVDMAESVMAAVVAAQRTAAGPVDLRTSDGEAMVSARAFYDLLDGPSVERALTAHRSFEREENGFRWISGKRRRGLFAGHCISLGRVAFEAKRLVLTTNSRERLAKGKALLAKLAGPGLRHRVDELGKIEQAPGRAPEPQSASAIPPAVQREIVRQATAEHYRRWLDEPLPALDRRTPRQAARDPRLRPRLVALLADIAWFEARREPEPLFDAASLRAELGIAADE